MEGALIHVAEFEIGMGSMSEGEEGEDGLRMLEPVFIAVWRSLPEESTRWISLPLIRTFPPEHTTRQGTEEYPQYQS